LDITLQLVIVTVAALTASPSVGAAPFFTSFLLQIPLGSVGTNSSAVWTFGDGSASISSTASTTDDITPTTATHIYAKPGTYTAQVAFTTTLPAPTGTTTLTQTTQVQVQRDAAD